MSSIQERLQLKRVPIDTWNIREQLCLASAVVRSGDQNWMSVSRALKTVGDANRPPDWYSQKSCAAQYGALLEHVETPKRKKRSSEGAVETPQESILKRLTQERIVEIQKTVAEMNQQYEQLKTEITEARNSNTSDERLREMWAEIEAAKRARERDSARRAAWLKEREEKRARSERTWRPPAGSAGVMSSSPSQPSSPLLTSLLKSSPVVTTPQHITHPASVMDTVSPSAGAPTLSMLLEKNTSQPQPQTKQEPPENKHAAIEHIKSQLVQIEQQLKAQPTSGIAPAVDIDDIEIKAEDVYAFRDIQLQIPQPTVPQTAAPTYSHNLVHSSTPDKPVDKKDEQDDDVLDVESQAQAVPEQSTEQIKEEPVVVDAVSEEVVSVHEQNVQREQEAHFEVVSQEVPVATSPEAEPEVPHITSEDIKFPEVKFPSPEIKVVTDDLQIKEEVKESEPLAEADVPAAKEQSDQEELNEETQPSTEPLQPDTAVSGAAVSVSDDAIQGDTLTAGDVIHAEPAPEPPLPPEAEAEAVTEEKTSSPEVKIELETPDDTKTDGNESSAAQQGSEIDRREDDEDSIPLREIMREEAERKAETEAVVTPTQEIKDEQDLEETHTETDDDTPMELSREEEKDGKKKRDYSRKKKPDRTYSGSSISLEGGPGAESPGGGGGGGGAPDADRHHRLWKKSVMLVYSRLCAHKYASVFQRPISDDEAPGYSLCIKRPMDLTTIRKNIEQGHVRTTAEFQRDVLLMLSNALMYNHTEHSVYRMAKDMHEEAQSQLGMLLAAQAHAGLVGATHTRKRRRHDPHSLTHTPDKKAA